MTAKWPEVRLGDHIEFLTSGSRGWSQYVRETGAQFIRIQNVGRNELIFQDMALVQPPSGAEAERTQVRPGDILISITADLGRTAVIPRNFGTGYINQHLALVRVRDFDPHFVSSFIGLGPGRQQLIKLDRGGVKSGLNFDDIRSITLPRPSISEQQQIVSILDKADAIRRMRRESVRLAEELLRSTFLEMFGDPVTNPKGWKVQPLGEVIEQLEAGWSANGDPRLATGTEFGVLKVSAVTSGYFRPEEHKAVSAELVDRPLVTPRAGDLLFSRANTRELVGATCLVESDQPRLFLPDKIWRVVVRDGYATTPYLRFLLSHERFRCELTKTATGTSGSMLNVSMDKLKQLRAPIPSFNVQKRFSAFVWAGLQSKARFAGAETDSNNLFDSLLDRAFRGELTSSETMPRQLSIFPGESRRS